MDNNNLFNKDNPNGEQGQFQQQPYSQQTYQQPYQNFQQQQPMYQQQQPMYQQQPYQSDLEEAVSFGDWMITMVIMLIPCVNIVMMFVWAFSSTTNKSKSNYFKATLVWMLITIVLSILMVAIYGASFAAAIGSTYY